MGYILKWPDMLSKKKADWLDPYSIFVIENAADAAAQYCLKYHIPIVHLTDEELGGKLAKGLVSHAQVSEVFKKSDHTDPGTGFPWEHFLGRVQFHYDRRK